MMKNIKQLRTEIKAAGLSGTAAEIELRSRLLREAEETILFIVNSPNTPNMRVEYLVDDVMRILEIFAFSKGDFCRRDFASDLQEFLFRQTHRYGDSYNEWRAELFGEKRSGAAR